MPESGHSYPDASNHQHITRWEIDPERSDVRFSVRHLMVSVVHGRFTSFRGDLVYDHQLDQPIGVMVEIDAGSVDTGQVQRDIHLRSGDFFDVENYPHIRFATREVELIEDHHYRVHGDLRLLRATREVELDVQFKGISDAQDGEMRAAFSARTSVNRHDFGLTWNRAVETGGLMVGEEVSIELDIEAIKQD